MKLIEKMMFWAANIFLASFIVLTMVVCVLGLKGIIYLIID